MTLTSKFCQDLAEFALGAGKLFIIIALLAAVAHVVVYSIVKLRESRAQPVQPAAVPAGIDKILDALKGVLEALANLPHWVAIFLAGLALLWIAGQRPDICTPLPARSPPGNSA